MTNEERRNFVEQLSADFRTAKESNSQDVATWMNLANRYAQISANMNWAYCARRASECRPAMHVVTDLGMSGMALALTLVPVAMETEER